MILRQSHRHQFITALLFSTLVSEALFGYNVLFSHTLEFDYLSWNLLLAWIPLLLAMRLRAVLSYKLWSSWEALILSLFWLIFLPNSFYMITDYIHIQNVVTSDAVYAALILTSFIYTGVALGFTSLFLIHNNLKQRVSSKEAAFWIYTTLFISSVAIYFGRDLRWNSWDVFINPGGLLFDVSDRLLNLFNYPQMIISILAMFILLCAMYNLLDKGTDLFIRTKESIK